MASRLAARLAGFGLFVLVSGAVAWASGTYVPPLPPTQNKAQMTGEKLWNSKKLPGKGGQSCAECHDGARGTRLDRASLMRKRDDLSKLVYFELVTHSQNQTARPEGPEVQALVRYLETMYRLDEEPPAPDAPEALAGLEEARQLYGAKDYVGASVALNKTLELTLSPRTEAECHILLGAIFDVLGDRKRAREEFAEVLRLYPGARLDAAAFPGPTIELFESVRSAVGGA